VRQEGLCRWWVIGLRLELGEGSELFDQKEGFCRLYWTVLAGCRMSSELEDLNLSLASIFTDTSGEIPSLVDVAPARGERICDRHRHAEPSAEPRTD